MLVFSQLPDQKLSLLDFAADLYEQFGLSITKQSLQNRFNEKAVLFMKSCLDSLLTKHINIPYSKHKLNTFNRVRIKDSTRYNLPASYQNKYVGLGGTANRSKAMISIQYEYDLLSGQTLDLRLTKGTDNDQSDSRDYLHDIKENDLFIRDLAYATCDYMLNIINKKAFFINRLSAWVKAYHADEPNKEIDFKKCLKKLKKHSLDFIEINALVGAEHKVPARLIISRVDQKTYEKRIKSSSKSGRRGKSIKEEFKTKSRLNLFITNTDPKDVPSTQIQPIYSLRWQIELIFKIWKSQAKINAIKEVKIHRFECQLLGKLIWLTLNWKIFRWMDNMQTRKQPENRLSVWKYYKSAFRLLHRFREVSILKRKITAFIKFLENIPENLFLLEKKKGKPNNYQKLTT